MEIKLRNIKPDPLGEALSESPEMRPYIDALVAAMTGNGQQAALERIRALPSTSAALPTTAGWRGPTLSACAVAMVSSPVLD